MNTAELPLRDIHLPDAPGWWPLAPGWWLLAGLALLIAAVVYLLWRRRRDAVARLAAREVRRLERGWRETSDDRALLRGLAQTLRRSAIAISGRDAAAGLVGASWREHLNAPLVDRPFDTVPASLLLDAAYRPEIPDLAEDEVTQLVALCRRWPRAALQRARS